MGNGQPGYRPALGSVGKPAFNTQPSPRSLPAGGAEGMAHAVRSAYGYGVPQQVLGVQPQPLGHVFGHQRGLLSGPASTWAGPAVARATRVRE